MARETREEAAQQARMERATHVGASTAMAWVVLAICLVLELLVVLVNLVREATGDTGYMTRAFVGHMTREALSEMPGLAQRLAMVALVFDGLPFMLSIAVRSKREHISLPSLCGARLVVFFMMRAFRYHIVECVDAPLFVVVSLVPLLVYANVLALKLLPPAPHAADVCQAQ